MTSRRRHLGDHTSHKIIEKRRRDRINNCLAELSRSVPTAHAKQQTSGKLEKAEILELTVEYLHTLHNQPEGIDLRRGELHHEMSPFYFSGPSCEQSRAFYYGGFNECARETFHFIHNIERIHPQDPLCVRLMSYLQSRTKHYTYPSLPRIQRRDTSKELFQYPISNSPSVMQTKSEIEGRAARRNALITSLEMHDQNMGMPCVFTQGTHIHHMEEDYFKKVYPVYYNGCLKNLDLREQMLVRNRAFSSCDADQNKSIENRHCPTSRDFQPALLHCSTPLLYNNDLQRDAQHLEMHSSRLHSQQVDMSNA